MVVEARPELEVACEAEIAVDLPARFLPQVPPPKSRLLLDPRGARAAFPRGERTVEERFAGEPGETRDADTASVHVPPCRVERREPAHLRECAHDRRDGVQCPREVEIVRVEPAHDLGGARFEPFLNRVVLAGVGLADPPVESVLVRPEDLDAAVGGSSVDDDVFEI